MIHTSAPATLMLMGEHAVLRGKHALVASTDQRLHVYLTPRSDRIIKIDSALGNLETTVDTIAITPPFSFACALIEYFKPKLPSGFDLKIDSEFSATVGLGSSAAVLVALTYALLQFTKTIVFEDHLQKFLFDIAYASLIKVQGQGSGADLAASMTGGIICYRQKPFYLEQLNVPLLPITLVYSGYKTPTPEVIAHVNTASMRDPARFNQVFIDIDAAVLFARDALLANDQSGFIQAFRTNQKCMDTLGVVDSTLQCIFGLLSQDLHILAAKVSGSGLGDCVLGIGHTRKCAEFEIITAKLANTGVILHEHTH